MRSPFRTKVLARRLCAAALAAGMVSAALPAASASSATPRRTCFGIEATIVGTSGNDVLVGTKKRDVIHGLGGDDVIRGGDGNDIICGGYGNDLIVGNQGDDLIRASSGDDIIRGGSGDDRVWAGSGSDRVLGGGGGDTIYGGTGADSLAGGGGTDRLRGDSGNDDLRGGAGRDILMGSGDNDELTGDGGADSIDGGPGNDVIWEFLRGDVHVAAGTPAAADDVFAYRRLQVTPNDGWLLWQPAAGQLTQGHEGALTITNRNDGLLMVERIEPERYLLGIAEMPYSWEPAALESQAVAARTYLASLLANPRYGPMAEYGFDICDHAACQVYKGTKYGWLEPWEEAVAGTSGQILLYGGAPASTFYHSTSGDTTRSIQDVWTGSAAIPYLQAVSVPKQKSPFAKWWYKLPKDAFMDILAHDGVTMAGSLDSILTVKTAPGDGPYRVRIRTTVETRVFEITTIQRALNRYALSLYPEYLPPLHRTLGEAALSPTFTVKTRSDGYVGVRGKGWGHQIGLSQYGANALAASGATADEILNHFYTGLTPKDDPGIIPDLIDVGLFYANGSRRIVLRPTGGYVLRSDGGIVSIGTGGRIAVTRYGADAVALRIKE
ncbi:MAG: SpoIID/LytB domain-containing protein [Actinobacteria bacterium]|nr:SpoIID/LytB domain-containing protein [Actinomycetota bacterium]